MKVNDTTNAATGARAAASGEAGGNAASASTAVVAPPSGVPAVDKVSTDAAAHLQDSVVAAAKMAASERALRLQALTQEVRSGNYHPNVSQLADQILAQAELEVRLAKNMH